MNKLNYPVLLRNLLFAFLAFGVLSAVFYPLAQSYLSFYPPLGNDFYHSFNLINFLKNNLTWPHLSWRYIWDFGGPTIIAYPWLNFYLVQPLVNFFGLYYGSLYYFLGSLLLYGFVSYLLFFRISRSFFLSLGLAVTLLWSANTWRLIVAGSLTLTVNQFFLAVALLLIVIYLESKKRKFLYLTAAVCGLAVWSQSGSAFPLIIPTVLIVIAFWWQEGEKFWQISRKTVDVLLFIIISQLVASFYLYYTFINVLGSRSSREVFDWMRKEAFSSILDKTNPSLFAVLVFFLLIMLFSRRLTRLKMVLPFMVAFLYLVVFNLSTILGLNPFGASLAPAENWYIFTLLIAIVIAVGWREIGLLLEHRGKWLHSLVILGVFIILLLPFGFWQAKNLQESFTEQNLVCGVPLPGNAVHDALVKNDLSGINEAFPNWMDKDNVNHRFLTLTAWCLDIWWNSLAKMPINNGYDTLLINPIMANYISWTNDLFSRNMDENNLPAPIIKNYMLFHIDWLGGRYIEQVADNLSYLQDSEIIKSGNKPEGYRLFEFKDEITSPIVRPTIVPAVLVVSSQNGYDTILRVLAQENLNSRFLVTVKGSPYIDDLTKENLEDFDGVILYDYQYREEKAFHNYPQKPWERLASYVKNGGMLFIETGSEVKESDLNNLPGMTKMPEVFPIDKTSREDLGTVWQLLRGESEILDEIDEKNFPPPVYDGSAWKLSVSESNTLRSWATPILSQEGKPILVSGKLGKGQVIWSGMTLPYHIQTYHNLVESKLFRNIFTKTLNVEEESVLPSVFKRDRSEHIELTAQNASGILFKENFNSGWQAKINKQKLMIYPAGFGFMYIKIPDAVNSNSQITVNIDYQGDPKYNLMFYMSLVTIVSIIIYFFIGPKIPFDRVLKARGISNWWIKDDEE